MGPSHSYVVYDFPKKAGVRKRCKLITLSLVHMHFWRTFVFLVAATGRDSLTYGPSAGRVPIDGQQEEAAAIRPSGFHYRTAVLKYKTALSDIPEHGLVSIQRLL